MVTGANAHDVTQAFPLVEAIPAVKGKRGRPRRRPDELQGDRGYDSEPLRQSRYRDDASTSLQCWQSGALPMAVAWEYIDGSSNAR